MLVLMRRRLALLLVFLAFPSCGKTAPEVTSGSGQETTRPPVSVPAQADCSQLLDDEPTGEWQTSADVLNPGSAAGSRVKLGIREETGEVPQMPLVVIVVDDNGAVWWARLSTSAPHMPAPTDFADLIWPSDFKHRAGESLGQNYTAYWIAGAGIAACREFA
jgi:hypothetical protein